MTLRRKFGHADGRRSGRLQGIGRIAGRKIAYVEWDNGDRISPYTLSEFRKVFGTSASKLNTGAPVVEVDAPREIPIEDLASGRVHPGPLRGQRR